MCGIFGYIGKSKEGADIALDGLKNLEYRGYDSWGVAWGGGGELRVKKSVGKISEAKRVGEESEVAIAHTRWATQGEVSVRNAHPHFSYSGEVAVVHNGVVENYEELKKEIGGAKFVSETDTEVLAHLIQKYLDEGRGVEVAFRKMMGRIRGRNAVLMIKKGERKIIAGRQGSPLILGVGKGEWFLASDIPAFGDRTRVVNYLDDGEMVVLGGEGVVVKEIKTGRRVGKRNVKIELEGGEVGKGDYEHYMLKEILDQKETIRRAVMQDVFEIERVAEMIRRAHGTYIIGCGTAGNVSYAGAYFFATVAGRHINFAPASEFPIYEKFLRRESLVIVISQSGETADVLEAMEAAKRKGSKVVALVNVERSSIARMADMVLPIKAGVEKAVASTKAATSQMALLLLLAYAVKGELEEGRRRLLDVSGEINDLLNPRYLKHIGKVAGKISKRENLFIVGKGANYPMALEAAIKIMEVSYVHAHGFAGGELKHGPIALIEAGTPCLVLMAEDEVRAEMLTSAAELKTRGGRIIGVGPKREEVFDEWLRVPDVGVASPLVNIIPSQILAYELAIKRGVNPDMPRNLAKSVTVK